MGPCPPIERHRYFFKPYALDRTLPDLDRPKVADLEQAMRGHVLAAGELIGTYQKAAAERSGQDTDAVGGDAACAV